MKGLEKGCSRTDYEWRTCRKEYCRREQILSLLQGYRRGCAKAEESEGNQLATSVLIYAVCAECG